jgi:hypothetical protein
MGDLKTTDIEIAALGHVVNTLAAQMLENTIKLDKIFEIVHRIELDNKSLYLTTKHHKERFDLIDVKLRNYGEHIDKLNIDQSKSEGGYSVAKWAFSLVSGIIWIVFSGVIVEMYQQIKINHDISIVNKYEIEMIKKGVKHEN